MHFHKNISLLFLSMCIGLLLACGKPPESGKKQPPPTPAPEAAPPSAPAAPEVPAPAQPETPRIRGEENVPAGKIKLLRKLQTASDSDRSLRGVALSTKRMARGEGEFFDVKFIIQSDGTFTGEVVKNHWCDVALVRIKCSRKVKSRISGTWEYGDEKIALIDGRRFVVAEIDAENKGSYVTAIASVLKLEWLDDGLPRDFEMSVYSGFFPEPFPKLTDENRL